MGRPVFTPQRMTTIMMPGRVKRSDAAAYIVNPVANRAPKRSPTRKESFDLVVEAMCSDPDDPDEMLRRIALALPPEIALTYSLRQYAVAVFTSTSRSLKKAG
jgi:hypothetical protein